MSTSGASADRSSDGIETIYAPLEPLIRIETVLGEGPVWEAETGTLHFVDVHCLHHYHLESGTLETDYYDCLIGSIALRRNVPGFIAAAQRGFAFLPLSLENSSPDNPTPINFILNPIEKELHHLRMFNDGGCDETGRFYAGAKTVRGIPMDDHLKLGSVFCFQKNEEGAFVAEKVAADFTIPNGIGFSKDSSKMYIADTRAQSIRCYDYSEKSGALTNEQIFITTPFLGRPDGLCLDTEDRIYSAKYAGSKVTRYLPDGTVDLEIVFENAYNVTAPVFGGPNMDVLFVTTGSLKESGEDKDPALQKYCATAGSVYAVHLPGVREQAMLHRRDDADPASQGIANAVLMPVLLGCCLHLIIYGILLSTFGSFLRSSWTTTNKPTRIVVALVMAFTTLSAALQISDVVHFGTLQQRDVGSLMQGTLRETTEPLWVGIVGCLVEGVLAVRAARDPLMQPTTTPNLNQCAGIWLGSSAGADLIISATFIVLLRKRLMGSGEKSDTIIRRVCHIAVKSAAYTACFAVPGAILCMCFNPNVVLTADIYYPFFLPLPSLYALSLFTTLNIRDTVLSVQVDTWVDEEAGEVYEGEVPEAVSPTASAEEGSRPASVYLCPV
ncbi:hypothetical protein MNV49_000332 [Pseudohyphozyma bogoriensis]|nr:hypothetical protein MNV49_000332 [Pseudohyphozyma bogoriensis]